MSTFRLTIDTDNAAFFDNDPYEELASILSKLSVKANSYGLDDSGTVLDSNGNSCGEWEIS